MAIEMKLKKILSRGFRQFKLYDKDLTLKGTITVYDPKVRLPAELTLRVEEKGRTGRSAGVPELYLEPEKVRQDALAIEEKQKAVVDDRIKRKAEGKLILAP
jgi:hypothetical protein